MGIPGGYWEGLYRVPTDMLLRVHPPTSDRRERVLPAGEGGSDAGWASPGYRCSAAGTAPDHPTGPVGPLQGPPCLDP